MDAVVQVRHRIRRWMQRVALGYEQAPCHWPV